MLVNCSVWTFYAAARGLVGLLIPNAIGIFAGIYCTYYYKEYSTTPIPKEYLYVALAVIVISLLFVIIGRTGIVGTMAAILAICVYTSPLATIRTVIREKSTETMPFPISLLVWFNALFWTLYGGIVAHDGDVLIPSLIGLLVTSIQLFLFILYGLPSRTRSGR